MNQDYATKNGLLVVQKYETGETITVSPRTYAGIYQLAKFLRVENTKQALVDAINSIVACSNLSQFIKASKAVGIYAKLGVSPRNSWLCNTLRFEPLNVHYDAIDGEWMSDADLVMYNYRYLNRKFVRKYRHTCLCCNEPFFDQLEMEHDFTTSKVRRVVRLIKYGDLGYDGYCADCVNEEYDYDMSRCSECGLWLESDEGTLIDGEMYCDYCRDDNFRCCDECGNWFRVDSDDCVFTQDGCCCFCDSDCAERYGYHYSESRDGWYDDDEDDEVDNVVCDYHTHKGYLEPVVAKIDKRKKQELYTGCETEIDGLDRFDFDEDYYNDLLKLLGNNCVFERDGSLDGGFEIITKPMDETSFKKFDWEKAFGKLRDDGWRSHDNSNCGTHFHFSIGYLGYNDNQRKNNAKKVCRFMQLYAEDVQKIARRRYGGYCEGWNKEITKNTSFDYLADCRYHAVNLENYLNFMRGGYRAIPTIEIRCCKGTLIAKTRVASMDFFLHIVRNAKRISWKNIANLKLWFKGIKDKDTIEYIKSRDAFVGEF